MSPHKAPSLNSHGREHFSTGTLKNLLFFAIDVFDEQSPLT